MSLSVRTNIASLISINTLNRTQNSLGQSVERISTGRRINGSHDDAAGMSIGERMRSDIISNDQVLRNINDGISMVQAVESYIGEIQSIVTRLRELGVQALNQASSSGFDGFREQRFLIAEESIHGTNEINRISNNLNFNRINLLNNTDTSFSFQVGIANSTSDRISINLSSLATTVGALGLGTFVSSLSTMILNQSGTYFGAFLDQLDDAFTNLSTKRARLGGLQNRLENALSNASTYNVNLNAAQSRIIDVDYASEASMIARFTIQHQAGVSSLAQANQLSRSIISLLS